MRILGPDLRRSATRSVDRAAGVRRTATAALAVAAVAAAWTVALGQATGPLPSPVVVVERAVAFVAGLAGAATDATPAYAQPAQWAAVGTMVVDTLVMSVVAMGIAGAGALATIAPASRLLTAGPGGRRASRRWLLIGTRGSHALLRGVPEVVWALLLVLVLRPGLLAGALALALHELGVLGRLGSDVVDDLDPGPVAALRATGASGQQVVLYGALPQVLPQFVTFALYRWEIVIRATVVVGFVTGVGLGQQLRLALSFRRWTEVGLVLIAYVLLVWLAEVVAALLRRLAR